VFGLREVPSFDAGVETPVAAEQVVDHEENQVGLKIINAVRAAA